MKIRGVDHEFCQLYNEPDIVKYIKINRLKWLGHVHWICEYRVPMMMLNGRKDGVRKADQAGGRWKDPSSRTYVTEE